jgi:hypothetical protein
LSCKPGQNPCSSAQNTAGSLYLPWASHDVPVLQHINQENSSSNQLDVQLRLWCLYIVWLHATHHHCFHHACEWLQGSTMGSIIREAQVMQGAVWPWGSRWRKSQ